MIRSAAGKVMWVGRATVFLVGLAVILALIFGVATSAMGADGEPFLLGKRNVASAISTLIKQGPGPALNLVVRAGQPPMAVNSATKVANLNADLVDGKSSEQFANGVGGKATDADKLDGQEASAFLPAKTYEFEFSLPIGPDTSVESSLPCDQGDLAMSGGFNYLDAQSKVVRSERRDDTSNVWVVGVWNQSSTAVDNVEYEVVCADFPPLRP